MYLVGIDENNKPFKGEPCHMCKRHIINAGLEEVITINENAGIHVERISNWIKAEIKAAKQKPKHLIARKLKFRNSIIYWRFRG